MHLHKIGLNGQDKQVNNLCKIAIDGADRLHRQQMLLQRKRPIHPRSNKSLPAMLVMPMLMMPTTRLKRRRS